MSVCYHCDLPITVSDYPGDREVNCTLCLKPFHAACRNIVTPEMYDHVKAKIVHILCQHCLSNQLRPTHESDDSSIIIPESAKTALESSIEANLKVERSLSTLTSSPGVTPRPKLQLKLCNDYNYGYGFCSYGSTCRFNHVNVCWNFIGTGSCLDKCKNRLFHQEVCRSSLESRTCYNKDCKRYHITGTKRRKPRNLVLCPPDSLSQPRSDVPLRRDTVTPPVQMGLSQKIVTDCGTDAAPPNMQYTARNPATPKTPKIATPPHDPVLLPNPVQLSNNVSSLQTNVRHHQQRLQVTETMLHQLTTSFSHSKTRMEEYLNSNTVGLNTINSTLNQAMQVLDYMQNSMNSMGNSLTLNEVRIRNSEEAQNNMAMQIQQLAVLFHNPRSLPSHSTINSNPQPRTLCAQPQSFHQNFSPQSSFPQSPQAVGSPQPHVIPNDQNFSKEYHPQVPR